MGRYSFDLPNRDEVSPQQNEEQSLEECVGQTVLMFEELDDQLSTAISFLLRRGEEVGRIVTCGLSFRAKVNLLEVLFRTDRPTSSNLESLREVCGACLEVEQKRNEIVHSIWRRAINGGGVTRHKYTARGKHGLREQKEHLTLNQIEAVWCHCGFLAHSVDELMFMEFDTEYGTMEDPPEVRALGYAIE
jgi:hypothetical protein